MAQHSFQVIEEDGGVPVAVTSGGPRYTGELFTYEKVMVLDTEQSEDTLLFRPSQFMADDAGNMYIYDQGIGSILAFNPEGRFTHFISRTGSGPGESIYAQIELIHDGIIQFYGLKERRTTRFRTDGTILDITTMPTSVALLGNTNYIILSDGRQLILTNETQIDNKAPKNAKGGDTENQRWGAIILSADGDIIGEANTPWTRVSKVINMNLGVKAGYFPVPIAFGAQPGTLYHPGHGIVLSMSARPELHLYDDNGSLVRTIRIDMDPEPVTAADKDAARQTFLRNWGLANDSERQQVASLIDQIEFADEKAFWGMVEIDVEGFFWLDLSLRPESESPDSGIHEFMVLSPEGEYLGNTSRPYRPDTHIIQGRMYLLEEDPETGEILPTVYRINSAVSGLKYPN